MHQRPWTAALLGPAPDHLALLANAGLVLHPHLDGARLGMIFGDLRQAFGKARLERRLCIWVRLVVLRSTHQLLQVQQMQLDAYRFGAHADAPGTLDQSNNVANPELGPAGLAVLRPGQHHPFQFGILLRGEPGGATGDLAIAQPGNAFGIVSLHRPGQIPRRQANQFRRFLTAAPVQDVGNAKQATHHLPGLLQPSQQPQTLRVAVLPHRDHRRSPPSDLSLRARHPKMLTQETTDLSRDPYNSFQNASTASAFQAATCTQASAGCVSLTSGNDPTRWYNQ